jgi:pyruvate-formate lyase-activating enzyme
MNRKLPLKFGASITESFKSVLPRAGLSRGAVREVRRRLRVLRTIYGGSGEVPLAPNYTVMVEVTGVCNLSCPLCPVALNSFTLDRGRRFMTEEDFDRIVELTFPLAQLYNLQMLGEPLLHKSFFRFWQKVSAKSTWISTHLNYPQATAEKLAQCRGLKIVCSLDGYDEESYNEYRAGGRFEVVRRNLEILAEGDCEVYPQFLINSKNETRVGKMREFVSGFNIPEKNVVLKPMDMNFHNENIGAVPGGCHSFHQGFYFNVDGVLQPCCVNVGRDMRLLHISGFHSTADLLNHPKLVAVRKGLAEDKNQYASCVSCKGLDFRRETLSIVRRGLSAKIL